MKPVCCDTSFLFALYGSDVHSAKALAILRRLQQPLSLSLLNEFELENAWRFASWRKLFSREQIDDAQIAFEEDRNAGHVVMIPCNLASVVKEARRLSEAHTFTHGHRAFDILHVAVALQLNAESFLSFDANQRQLAQVEGLKLNG